MTNNIAEIANKIRDCTHAEEEKIAYTCTVVISEGGSKISSQTANEQIVQPRGHKHTHTQREGAEKETVSIISTMTKLTNFGF